MWTAKVALFGLASLLFLGFEVAQGQEKAPRPAAASLVEGVFQAVDLQNGTLELLIRDKPPRKQTFNLAGSDVPLTSEGTPGGKVSDLPVGTLVLLRISGSDDVVSVHVPARTLTGRIQAVDAEKRLMTLAGYADPLRVLAEAPLQVDGRFPPLGPDLVGKIARIRTTLDAKTVVGLQIPPVGRSPQIPADAPQLQAILLARDLASGRLEVREMGKDDAPVRTFETEQNLITSLVDGKGNSLRDILPGMKLLLRLTSDEKRILWLKAEPPVVDVIRRIDREKRTITVAAGKDQPERTYRVDPDAKMLINGWPSDLQDFRPGWLISAVPDRDGKKLLALWILLGSGELQRP